MLNRTINYLLISLLIISSCKKENHNSPKESIVKDTIRTEDKTKIRAIGETLIPIAKAKVENWSEYQQLDQLLERFYSISPNQALNLSEELSTITKQLKDSIKIERFKQPDIGIRINVLYNSTLRLVDMASIPTIKPIEVQNETQNILDAFSALNSKINNLSKQEKIENELRGMETN